MVYDTPLSTLLLILTKMATSIALTALLLVAAGLVKNFEGNVPANITHLPTPQELASDRVGNIGGRGRRGGCCRGCNFRFCHTTYVCWLATPFLVQNFWDGLVKMLGFGSGIAFQIGLERSCVQSAEKQHVTECSTWKPTGKSTFKRLKIGNIL